MIRGLFLILLFSLIAFTADAKQIKITSDRLEIVRTDNTSTFSGNVYAFENNLKIWSDKLIVTSSKDEKKIKRIDAFNNVKILRDQLSIYGNNAKYNPNNNSLIVLGEVTVKQNGNIIICDEIVIDLENSSSIMKSDSNKRVEALLISENIN